MATHPWHVVLHDTTYTNLMMSWWFTVLLSPKYGITAWVLRGLDVQYPMYSLHPSFVRILPCTHNTCGISGNTSISYSSLCHNINHHHNGLLVLEFSPNLICSLCTLWLGLVVPTRHVEWVATHPWHVVLQTKTYTTLPEDDTMVL